MVVITHQAVREHRSMETVHRIADDLDLQLLPVDIIEIDGLTPITPRGGCAGISHSGVSTARS
jgi:hypothetical protein